MVMIMQSQQLMVKATAYCFDQCVSVPGKDLSSSQQTCLWRCAQNQLESAVFMQKRLLHRAQNEGSAHH